MNILPRRSHLTLTDLVEHGVFGTESDEHPSQDVSLTDTDLVEDGVVGTESDEHHACPWASCCRL